VSITIDSELKDVLGQINQKLDRLDSKIEGVQNDITDLKISVVRLEEGQKNLSDKVAGLDKRLEKVETQLPTLVADISDLKGAKSLIIPIVVAVLTSLTTLLIRAIPNP
jgi:predicted nuclease with TOPRIM domain